MYKLKYHPSLTTEKWQKFKVEQQILMIGNELNRLINGVKADFDPAENIACMERVLELTDLTISCQGGNLRKELLRWRDLIAESYMDRNFEIGTQQILLKTLLFLNSISAKVA